MDERIHAALIIIRPTELKTLIATAAVGGFAGILPDIDTGGTVAPIIHKITAAFIESINSSEIGVNLLGLDVLFAFSIYGGTQPYRGFTHSLLALLIASFGAYLIFRNLALAFGIGYASHLLIDMVNKKGDTNSSQSQDASEDQSDKNSQNNQ